MLYIEAVVKGAIDRQILGSKVLGSPEKLTALEQVIHPLVARERDSVSIILYYVFIEILI